MGEGIVAAVKAGDNLVCLVCRVIDQGVDIGSEARGGRGIDPRYMVIHSRLFCARLHALFDQVDEIRRPQFS